MNHSVTQVEWYPFSLPDLILRLHRTYQPLAESQRQRFVVKTEHRTPLGLMGDLDQIETCFKGMIMSLLEGTFGGRIDVEVIFERNELQFVIAESNKGVELRAKFKVSLEENVTHLEEETMVLAWLMKDIEMSDLVEEVLKTLPERLEVMEEQVAINNVKDFKESVHALKGTTGNFGMTELYNLLLELDRNLKINGSITEESLKLFESYKNLLMKIPRTYLVE